MLSFASGGLSVNGEQNNRCVWKGVEDCGIVQIDIDVPAENVKVFILSGGERQCFWRSWRSSAVRCWFAWRRRILLRN